MNAYMHALRAPFLAGSLIPILIGGGYAILRSSFDGPRFLLCLLGVGAIHLGANLINDYYDARGSDPINRRLTPFSGGSRVIQDGTVPSRAVLAMALGFFVLSLACGMALALTGRPLVLIIGTLGFGAGWSYSASPVQLMARGFGEIVIFFAFGPLITLGTYYALCGVLSVDAFLIGIPHGFLIAEVIWINQFPDYEADRAAGKRNLVVRWGLEQGRAIYVGIILLSFVSLVLLPARAKVPFLVLAALLALPFGIKASAVLWREYRSHEGIVPAQARTIQTLVVQGLLVTLGLAAGRFLSG
ncbi:MAG: 1,4-dihydroxy-2-naphthoate octaprenyltransferase [Desulfobacteraceae bacterium]|jgi:1,4-dihydroxy-2-naphthoate octaprenyltransferase